jgi:hypothetical protein
MIAAESRIRDVNHRPAHVGRAGSLSVIRTSRPLSRRRSGRVARLAATMHFPGLSFPCLYNLSIGTRQTQGPKPMHIPNRRRMPLCFLLHRKRNLGLAPLVFGLYGFCWGSISFACHRIQFLGLKGTIVRYVFRPRIAKAERGGTVTATKKNPKPGYARLGLLEVYCSSLGF